MKISEGTKEDLLWGGMVIVFGAFVIFCLWFLWKVASGVYHLIDKAISC